MLSFPSDLMAHLVAGESLAVGTVVRTFRSAPRSAGAVMAVAPNGEVHGSVSGGCVEGAVYEKCLEVLATGTPGLEQYGVSDDDAFAVGLTCGGIIDVFIEKVSLQAFPEIAQVVDSVAAGVPVAIATVTSRGPLCGRHLVIWRDRVAGSLGSAPLDDAVAADGQEFLTGGRTGFLHSGAIGRRQSAGLEVFVSSHVPAARMLVFGAIDLAATVARMGKFLGYHVTVCDARPVFATAKRFPDADEVVVQWPHRFLDSIVVDSRSAICVLTHDPKFDVPLLQRALRTPAAYIGAMGSRRTHQDRLRKLLDVGVTDLELERLSSPIGLDIGARTPEETAVSIAAELIALRWGGSGRRLRTIDGPIHT
jgi:xanthine dehydrogenase accessory factor